MTPEEVACLREIENQLSRPEATSSQGNHITLISNALQAGYGKKEPLSEY